MSSSPDARFSSNQGANMNYYKSYIDKLHFVLDKQDWKAVESLALSLQEVWKLGKQVFLCGNGGSAANAIHFANDLIYGVAKEDGKGSAGKRGRHGDAGLLADQATEKIVTENCRQCHDHGVNSEGCDASELE